MTLQENITLSMCSITYNHNGLIEKAINSLLMQITDFGFEILLHDDASNDGTMKNFKSFKKQ
jgi:glycosyltransferase involved in cell wall biosynthesis